MNNEQKFEIWPQLLLVGKQHKGISLKAKREFRYKFPILLHTCFWGKQQYVFNVLKRRQYFQQWRIITTQCKWVIRAGEGKLKDSASAANSQWNGKDTYITKWIKIEKNDASQFTEILLLQITLNCIPFHIYVS